MNKPWKLVLLLAGIFLAGGVTGALLMVQFGRQWVSHRSAPEQWAPLHLRKLSERLELTPAQVDLLKPIVRRNMEELGRVRNQSMTESRAVMERMHREIAEQLTPDQRVRFDEYNRELREKMRKFMPKRPGEPREQRDRHDGPPPRPEGGARERGD